MVLAARQSPPSKVAHGGLGLQHSRPCSRMKGQSSVWVALYGWTVGCDAVVHGVSSSRAGLVQLVQLVQRLSTDLASLGPGVAGASSV